MFQNLSQIDDPVLRFGVFISQGSSDSNSFEYAGFVPSLEIGFETVEDSSVLTRETDGKKYHITYNISDAMVRYYNGMITTRSYIQGRGSLQSLCLIFKRYKIIKYNIAVRYI